MHLVVSSFRYLNFHPYMESLVDFSVRDHLFYHLVWWRLSLLEILFLAFKKDTEGSVPCCKIVVLRNYQVKGQNILWG